jgi:hypothetical protein
MLQSTIKYQTIQPCFDTLKILRSPISALVTSMKDVIKFKSHGKGAFAFTKESKKKVLKESSCALARNAGNVHGIHSV